MVSPRMPARISAPRPGGGLRIVGTLAIALLALSIGHSASAVANPVQSEGVGADPASLGHSPADGPTAQSDARCGGTAPFTKWCGAFGVASGDQFHVGFLVGPGFTGDILWAVAAVEGPRFQYEVRCTVVLGVLTPPVSIEGVGPSNLCTLGPNNYSEPRPGQRYELYGRAEPVWPVSYFHNWAPAATAVGTWEVLYWD